MLPHKLTTLTLIPSYANGEDLTHILQQQCRHL